MFDRSYQIVYLQGGQLKIADNPDWLLASPFLLFGLVSACFFVYRVYRARTPFPAWGLLIFSTPFLLAGLMCLRTGSLTLDRAENRAYLHAPSFLWHRDSVLPLTSIRHAEIRTVQASSYIALVLEDGEATSFADSTQKYGKGHAVDAINRYLGVPIR